MRNLSFVFLILLSFTSYAVIVKHCPQHIDIKISDIKINDFEEIQKSAERLISADFDSINYFKNEFPSEISERLFFKGTKYSNCQYLNKKNTDSDFHIYAYIRGTDESPKLHVDLY